MNAFFSTPSWVKFSDKCVMSKRSNPEMALFTTSPSVSLIRITTYAESSFASISLSAD